ncbi:MAG: M15 family metallopeptidase [Actinomycetota bacterium]|nr:M15 family metallopeptidase [Actinomycetota bacterium]
MRKISVASGLGMIVIALTACGPIGADNAPDETVPVVTSQPAAPLTTQSPSTTTTVTSTTTAPPTTSTTSAATTTTTLPAQFRFHVAPVTQETVWATWREDCPLHFDQLALLDLTYWNFDGEVAMGQLTINAAVIEDVLIAFEQLFDMGFPIEQIALVDDYDGDDKAAMRANVTSGFNCRYVDGTENWSNHAFGLAIDINPLINPWAREGNTLPAEGDQYTDRELGLPGMINLGDEPIDIFAEVGWTWGGVWQSADYMHFSRPGN